MEQSQLKSNTAILSIDNIWDKISGDLENIFEWLSELKYSLNQALSVAYDEYGSIDDNMVDDLTATLSRFDVSKQTIQNHFNKVDLDDRDDVEDFIDTLRIIATSKIDALLPDGFKLDMADQYERIQQERIIRQREKSQDFEIY